MWVALLWEVNLGLCLCLLALFSSPLAVHLVVCPHFNQWSGGHTPSLLMACSRNCTHQFSSALTGQRVVTWPQLTTRKAATWTLAGCPGAQLRPGERSKEKIIGATNSSPTQPAGGMWVESWNWDGPGWERRLGCVTWSSGKRGESRTAVNKWIDDVGWGAG